MKIYGADIKRTITRGHTGEKPTGEKTPGEKPTSESSKAHQRIAQSPPANRPPLAANAHRWQQNAHRRLCKKDDVHVAPTLA